MAEPNPKQTLILWALLAKGGAAAQKELGFTIKPVELKPLLEAKFLTQEKRGRYRQNWLEVTDKGWAWAGENLGATLPSGRNATRAGTPILQEWLGRLQAFMRANNVSLADLLTASPREEAAPSAAAAEASAKPPARPAATGDGASFDALRERVRRAYLETTGGRFNDTVPLSRIRAKLSDLDRATIDGTLRRMLDEPGTTLMDLGNPREIEPERAASINVGGREMHLLWISR
jgi:hypothetical protein